MSFWMELRCDAGHHGCLSHRNEKGPMGLYTNVIAGCKILARESEQQSWVYVQGLGHVCPKCKERRDANPS